MPDIDPKDVAKVLEVLRAQYLNSSTQEAFRRLYAAITCELCEAVGGCESSCPSSPDFDGAPMHTGDQATAKEEFEEER